MNAVEAVKRLQQAGFVMFVWPDRQGASAAGELGFSRVDEVRTTLVWLVMHASDASFARRYPGRWVPRSYVEAISGDGPEAERVAGGSVPTVVDEVLGWLDA